MTYTEVKERNGKRYYYRVRSIRNGDKFRKERIYMGIGLSGSELSEKEVLADKKLMKDKIEIGLKSIKPKIVSVLKKNNIKRAGIFGSYARGEQKKNSDVDILIRPPKNTGFGFAGIELELEKKLKKNVDLVSYNGISPYTKDRILQEEVRIL
ncbi:MAG: nucleotidyltransferase family protein [Candidatus Aenigmarchaeota archaeon]|nr:nucleotidyltransferase family protein [Candidatus Aenigmarchaeota archaeon]